MPDCDPNHGSLLLEGRMSPCSARSAGNKPIYQYTQKNEDNMKKLLSGNAEDADTKEPAQEARRSAFALSVPLIFL